MHSSPVTGKELLPICVQYLHSICTFTSTSIISCHDPKINNISGYVRINRIMYHNLNVKTNTIGDSKTV